MLGAGWWVAIAQLWPASSRPYFGGSTNNNILELALGYNGLGRLDGTETGSIGFNASSAGGAGRFGGGGGGGGGFGGATGIFRLFGSEFGGQVSWLIPAALISLGALLWVSRRRARVPVTAGVAGGSASPVTRMRAFAAIWGGWLLVTGVVFSYMQGIIHPYYMVALGAARSARSSASAPPACGRRGSGIAGRVCAAVAVAVTAWWSFVLLDRTPDWLPWLRWLVLIAGLAAMVALFAVPLLARALGAQGTSAAPGAPGLARVSRVRGLAWLPLAFALVAGLAGPLAYSLDTVNHTYTGAIPSAGPTVTGAFGVPGGGQGGFGGFGRGGFPRGGPAAAGSPAGGRPAAPGPAALAPAPAPALAPAPATAPGPAAFGGFGRFRGGTGSGSTGTGTGTGTFPGGGAGGFGGAGGGFGGGLSGNTQVSSALIKLLEQDASKYKWIAATEGSQEAAPIELATGGDAVMAIGGFNGTDPAPTLAQFEAMVAKGEIHYYVGRGASSFGGGTGSSAIASWVAAHFTAQTVGGTTVYDLTQAK